MSITDELRAYAHDCCARIDDDIHAIADRIDEQHAKERGEAYNEGVNDGIDADKNAMGYIKLPVDADGVPIHVGDKVAFLGRMTVDATDGHNVFFFADNWTDGVYCVRADELRHYHAPTVEDVLREFAQEMNENLGMYTGEAIDADEWRDADRKTIAEYAAKLRLAGDE